MILTLRTPKCALRATREAPLPPATKKVIFIYKDHPSYTKAIPPMRLRCCILKDADA